MEDNKDWEKEFADSFNKKIPFPMLSYEGCFLNPALDGVVYTLANASVHDDTKFELYMEVDTKAEIEQIVKELKEKDGVKPGQTPKKDDKNKKDKKAKLGDEETKEDVDPEQDLAEEDADPAVVTELKESGDYTEKAMIILQHRREEKRKQALEEKDKKAKSESTKKANEDKKDGDETEKEDNKKEEPADGNKEKIDFQQIAVDKTYGYNLKKCNKIITLWSVKSTGYRKIAEKFLFGTVGYTLTFSPDGKYFFLDANSGVDITIYDAATLEETQKLQLKCKDQYENDISYFYGTMMSYDGSYLIAGDSYSRYIFDSKTGKFLNKCDGRSMYTIYQYSKTEFAGCKYSDDTYTKTSLVAIDFLKDTERILHNFETAITAVTPSPDWSFITYESYPKIMYLDLKKGDKVATDLLKEYYTVYKYTYKDNKMCIVYSPNYNTTYVAVYEEGKQLWKQEMTKQYPDVRGISFRKDSEVDSLVMACMANGTVQIYLYEEKFSTDYCIKSIRNVIFQYPTLAYAWGTREVWVQDMNNNVRVYYFNGSISGMENSTNVRPNSNSPLELGLVLDYHDHYRIGSFTFTQSANELELNRRKLLKSELPDKKVKSFYNIRIENHDKKITEDGVMLHFKDSLLALSLESKMIDREIPKKLAKHNVIALRDGSALFFWEDKGEKIEMMKTPYDPTNPKAIQKVYEADDSLMLTKICYLDGAEHLLICDEQKYVKVLKIEENRVVIHKDYFVDSYFATYADVEALKLHSFSNDMLYSSSGGYILQEKGKEKENKFYCFGYGQYSFSYNQSKFPMCTEEFILWSLSPEYNADYTQQKQYLLLTPPMNSYRIKQRTFDNIAFHEFFLHFDDKYIVHIHYDPEHYYEDNQDYGEMNFGKLWMELFILNGEIIQTYRLPAMKHIHKPIFSQSGEYMALPCWRDSTPEEVKSTGFDSGKVPLVKVYRIKKSESYVRLSSNILDAENENAEDKDKSDKDVFSLEEVKTLEISGPIAGGPDYGEHIFSEYYNEASYGMQRLHVDNRGNVVFLDNERKIFKINDHENWSDFEGYITKFKSYDDIDMISFGQGAFCIKAEEKIFWIQYNDKKLQKIKEIKHKALDIYGECDLEKIVMPRFSKYIILFYDIREVMTIIVWDTDKDLEYSNFLGRKEDKFIDYITGKNSKLGFACFDKYTVDLDICVPIPFMAKKFPMGDEYWNQGIRINSNEDILLSKGTIVTPICHKDIYFWKNKSLDNLDEKKIVYYLDKRSVVFDYVDNYDKLKIVLEAFETNPLYYIMLVLEDNDGKSPLQLAIENNSPRIIELMLNKLLMIGHFSLSRKLSQYFSLLFKLNLKSFERYLNSCYFITEQMRSINKLDLQGSVDTIRQHYPCSILDKEFYKKYEVPDKDGNIPGKETKVKPNAVAPADRQGNNGDDDASEKELGNVFEEDEKMLKRVSIKGIEFDWLFKGDQSKQFLKDLSNSENIGIFGEDIIKDIILFQWSYFKKVIIWRLFGPYLLYFLLFCVYTTWLLERQFQEEDNSGAYHITSYVFGVIILLFNVFWAYVETRQIIFHKLDYLTSFWNLLDLFSVIMNVTVVIMDFANSSFQDTNRVAAVSVLVLYFKLFYFLRIFFATAYLVRMIIEIMLDMKFFVSVLMIATIAFANAFYILGRNSDPEEGNLAGENFFDAFIFSYKMGLGDFITDGFETRDETLLWIFFLLNSLIILIVLLNLVIAIMGDTFDRVQETQENAMLKELTNMIRENEFLFSRTLSFKKAKYIIVIEPEKAEGGGNVSWEGKLNQLKTFIEDSSEKHIQHLRKLQDEVETIAAIALDDKMKPAEDRINHKLSTCDQKMESIFKGVNALHEKLEKVEAENAELKKKLGR